MPASCVLFVCLPLSVRKTSLMMAGIQEAKPILQFLMAALQILCSLCGTLKPLFLLPPSKHVFNQLLHLVMNSSLRYMSMEALKNNVFYAHS